MPGLIQGLEIARRALLAHQNALNITGNNIANVNTDGYTRQKAILEPTPSETTPDGIFGTGVQMVGLQRARDVFLDVQIRDEMGLAGRWSARSDVLQRIEGLLSEPSDTGLGSLFDGFWNAWLDLSNQPEDAAARAVVVQSGQALAEGMQQLEQRVNNTLDATDVDLNQRVDHLNSLFDELATLNTQVSAAEVGGTTDAALRDRRDLILDELATEGGATNVVKMDGSVVVRLGGRTVVEGNTVVPLATMLYNDQGHVGTRVIFGQDRTAPAFLSGKLAGILEVRDQVLPDFMDQVDQLAQSLIEGVNRIHAAGPSHTAFFKGTKAGDIEVAPEVAGDSSQVNAGSSGDPGDNDIAVAIAALRDARSLKRGTATMSDFYRSAVAGLGSLTQQAKNMDESQSAAVQTLESQRQSIVGVNLDEELTHMVTTQKAFEAAARVFNSVSQMLDTLLQM
jgi:flagellar hook-associated protein 1